MREVFCITFDRYGRTNIKHDTKFSSYEKARQFLGDWILENQDCRNIKIEKFFYKEEEYATLKLLNQPILTDTKLTEILTLCQPHTEKVWSSKIISILLDCNFRDAKEKVNEYLQKNK